MTYTSWFKAAIIRLIRAGAQAAIGIIGASAVVADVDWSLVLGGTGLIMLLSFLTSLTGLPETVEDAPLEGVGKFLKGDKGQTNLIGAVVVVVLILIICRIFGLI